MEITKNGYYCYDENGLINMCKHTKKSQTENRRQIFYNLFILLSKFLFSIGFFFSMRFCEFFGYRPNFFDAINLKIRL